ncbi:MAG: OmpA family protein [Bernardetiaceae bacterium]|nr:OmpA family protein [Bernardetiaceae bacterium]
MRFYLFLSLFVFLIFTHTKAQIPFSTIELGQEKLPVMAIAQDAKGKIWAGTEKGLFCITPKNDGKHEMTHHLQNTPIAAITFDTQGKAYLATYQGKLYSGSQPDNLSLLHNYNQLITRIFIDAKGQVWLATQGGGVYLRTQEGELKHYDESDKLPSNSAFDIKADNEGNIWVATAQGLALWNERREKWKPERNIEKATALAYFQKTLFAAGNDAEGGRLYYYKDGKWRSVQLPEEIRYQRVTAMQADAEGGLWLAADRVAYYKYGQWRFYSQAEGFESRSAISLLLDAQQNLWVGTEGKGLFARIETIPTTLQNEEPEQDTVAETEPEEPTQVDTATSTIAQAATEETEPTPTEDLDEILNEERISASALNRDFNLDVRFEQGRAVLLAQYLESLDKIAAVLMRNPDICVEIAGHTDKIGNPVLNKQLSEQRAAAVKRYLYEEKGIPTARIKAIGYGDTRLLTTNRSEGEKNRRVEIRFLNCE